jgi:hypothetical protein
MPLTPRRPYQLPGAGQHGVPVTPDFYEWGENYTPPQHLARLTDIEVPKDAIGHDRLVEPEYSPYVPGSYSAQFNESAMIRAAVENSPAISDKDPLKSLRAVPATGLPTIATPAGSPVEQIRELDKQWAINNSLLAEQQKKVMHGAIVRYVGRNILTADPYGGKGPLRPHTPEQIVISEKLLQLGKEIGIEGMEIGLLNKPFNIKRSPDRSFKDLDPIMADFENMTAREKKYARKMRNRLHHHEGELDDLHHEFDEIVNGQTELAAKVAPLRDDLVRRGFALRVASLEANPHVQRLKDERQQDREALERFATLEATEPVVGTEWGRSNGGSLEIRDYNKDNLYTVNVKDKDGKITATRKLAPRELEAHLATMGASLF